MLKRSVFAFLCSIWVQGAASASNKDCSAFHTKKLGGDYEAVTTYCFEDGKLKTHRSVLSNNPNHRRDGNPGSDSELQNNERDKPVSISFSDSSVESLHAILNRYKQPDAAEDPSQYDLSKKDVEINQWRMMWAAIASTIFLAANLILLGYNLIQFRTANKHAKAMADVSHKTMITQLRPVLSMVDAKIDSIDKLDNGTVSAMIVMKIENTGQSESEIVSGWCSSEKSTIHAWGNGNQFKPNITEVKSQGPRHVYLNPGNTVNMICHIVIARIPEYIPEDKICFDIMASVTSKDIGTAETVDSLRLTYFNPVRTLVGFSESKKDWGDVELKTEIGNTGDRIKTVEDIKKHIKSKGAK